MEIAEGLRTRDHRTLERWAGKTLRPELRETVGKGVEGLWRALNALYVTGWYIQRIRDPKRQRVVLRALGCRAKSEKVFLSLLTATWPAPADEKLRKVAQSKLSRWASALEGAWLADIKPNDFMHEVERQGGIEGLAEVAVSHRRSEKTKKVSPARTEVDDEDGDAGRTSKRPARGFGSLNSQAANAGSIRIVAPDHSQRPSAEPGAGLRLVASSKVRGRLVRISGRYALVASVEDGALVVEHVGPLLSQGNSFDFEAFDRQIDNLPIS